MFIIPMGMALGAKITVSEFLLNNLIPVTVSSLVREAHHLGATGPLFHSLSDAEALMSPLIAICRSATPTPA